MKRTVCKGFTLLEVMVAIGILGFALTGVLHVFSTSMRGIGKTELYTEATLVAREMMETYLMQPELSEGTYTGESQNRFEWEVDVIQINTAEEDQAEAANEETGANLNIDWLEEDSPVVLYEVTVTVRWPNTGFPGQLKLTTLTARVQLDDSEETEE